MTASAERPIAAAVVEQASYWLMLQWDGGLNAEQRQALQHWQEADPEHRRAWARLQVARVGADGGFHRLRGAAKAALA